jgi:hypothetical protein
VRSPWHAAIRRTEADGTCRTPYCDAPIRHTDHATPVAHGGPTSVLNGLGECEACNYAKEAPGWRVHTWCDDDDLHTAELAWHHAA